jgi:ligand-binding sensor domain-containing protein/signal transduction histidine kinase
MPQPHNPKRLTAVILESTRIGAIALALALVPAIAAPASAGSSYIHRSWQVEDGLPQNAVTAVVQSRDGYLWLGTYSGLARFDGIRFTVFDENNTPELHNNRVTSLFEAENGTLWIGHENGEATRYQHGKFQAVKCPATLGGGKICDIGTDEAGDVWLLSEEGLLARLRDGLVLKPEAGNATKLVAMTRSKRGTIWVAWDGRVSLLKGGALHALQFKEAAGNSYVVGLGASSDGGLWMTCDGRIKKWKSNGWTEDLGQAPFGGSPATRMIETKNGTLVAGTSDRGLFLVSSNTSDRPTNFTHAGGFPSDWVLSLLEDRESNLWIGTGGAGLVKMRKSVIETVEPPDRWQGRPVLTASASRTGALWVGTEGAGLYHYHFQDQTWTHFDAQDGILNPYVWSIAEDPQGDVWVGTWTGGLFVRRGARFETPPRLEYATTIPMPAILCERPGRLWVGSGEGLLLYDAGQTTWFRPGNGSARKTVRAVLKDREGAIWFGSSGGGLSCLKNGRIQQFRRTDGLPSDDIECLHLDGDGSLWIGTFGGGLSRLKQGRFAVIGRNEGFPNSVICDIQEDDSGFFWMSSHGGVFRVSKTELNRCADGQIREVHPQTFGLSEGLPTLECSEGRGCKTSDGRLWFPTSKGLANLDPQNIAVNPLPPPVVIEKMLVDGRRVGENPDVPSPVKIPPGRHRLDFEYTGLSLVAPEKVQFKYRLNGFETEWRDAGSKRGVNYTYIPPGNYSFQVIACNNDGVWNQAGAAMPFRVMPFFWQTWWFRILAWTLVFAGGGGLVWFETRRRMQHKLEWIERQRDIEHERARIANDIHDDLGADLTRITMLSEAAREERHDPVRTGAHLDKIYDTALKLTGAMDEIVWAVNPRHDTLEGLSGYLEKYAQDVLATANIRCRLELPLQFPDWRLTAEVRHNLFLAFKEALHNVLKHAAASEVHVQLTPRPASFELAIKDNGCGFALGTTPGDQPHDPGRLASGNGLDNMIWRLAEIGGNCVIHTALGEGTTVVFSVPLKTAE